MSQIMAPFQLLELNVISAQDLAPLGRNMRTYAVAWVHPDRKLSTRVDTQGHTNPTWNDKFVFRVEDEFLYADSSAIMVEIYALHWFKDIHVGTVRVLVANLIPPSSRPSHNHRAPPPGLRFVALQVRRPSGRPQGILNIGVSVLDSSMRSMPLYTLDASAVGYRHLMGEKDVYNSHSPNVFANATPGRVTEATKPELRRTKSDSSSVLATDAVMRQQRAIINHSRPSSNVSGESQVSNKKKNKKKKKKKSKRSFLSSSVVSDDAASAQFTSSILSETVAMPWMAMNGEVTSNNSTSHAHEHMELPPSSPPHDNEEVQNDIDNHNGDDSFSNTISDATTNEIERHNIAYKVNATPKRQFEPSPAMSQFKNSPKPQFKNSPLPEYRNFPKPQFKNSPMPQFRNSPMPQFRNSPMPEFRNSPKPEFRNSPMPQFKNSPMPQFRNSPKPQFLNSPMVAAQYRNSPAMSKFNPAVGFGGSNRGTPLHPFGKMNGGFEYATPMRSNLGNMRPVVMTESELGPSPSEVAAMMARKPMIDEGDNSTVGGWSLDESVEGLQTKMERWRTELPPVIDRGELSSLPTSTATKSNKSSRRSRRKTDGGNGLFSCFSNICGIECSIVCGGGDPKGKKKLGRQTSSPDHTSSLF